VPFLEIADPDFSVTSDEVHRAREAGWYAHTSYGIAVLRHHQASQLISHPSLRQGSSAWPAHHGITSGPLLGRQSHPSLACAGYFSGYRPFLRAMGRFPTFLISVCCLVLGPLYLPEIFGYV